MKSVNIYTVLISYFLIFLGVGILLEFIIELQHLKLEIILALRYFYWSFNVITFGHFLLLLPYTRMKDEMKKSRFIFFISINHFVLILIAVAAYAIFWFKGNREEGIIAMLLYLFVFILFIAILMWQSKK